MTARFASLVAAAAIQLLASPAEAAGDHRLYVGTSGSYAAADGVADADPTLPVSNGSPESLSINRFGFDDDDFAWSAFVGYSIWKLLGVELDAGAGMNI